MPPPAAAADDDVGSEAISGNDFTARSWVDSTLVRMHPTPRQRQRGSYDNKGGAGKPVIMAITSRMVAAIAGGGQRDEQQERAGGGGGEIVTMSVVGGDDAAGGGSDNAMRAGGRPT